MKTAYRSDHPDVLASMRENDDRLADFNERVQQFRADYPRADGEPRGVMCAEMRESICVEGIAGPQPEGPWQRSGDVWVPNRRLKAGRDLAARIRSLQVRFRSPAGVPAHVSDFQKWYAPRVVEHGGYVWIGWNCDAELLAKRGLDLAMWEPVRLSEMYAAIEAADEAA